jgi:hypothetical protein
MSFDWSRYAVGGAAARPDSFTGLDPEFAAALQAMLLAAEADGLSLRITSAYRSPDVQAKLWDDAVVKYGSEEAARKWVAPPGRSMHNRGVAVDFAGPDGLLRDAKSAEAQWLATNAARFGLNVPMSWEPWQIEMAGARGHLGFGPNVSAVNPRGQGILPVSTGGQGILPVSTGEPVVPTRPTMSGILGAVGDAAADLAPRPMQVAPMQRRQFALAPSGDRTAPYRAFMQSLRA